MHRLILAQYFVTTGGAPAALQAYLDSIEAEGPLSAEAEAALTQSR